MTAWVTGAIALSKNKLYSSSRSFHSNPTVFVGEIDCCYNYGLKTDQLRHS